MVQLIAKIKLHPEDINLDVPLLETHSNGIWV